MPRKPGGPHQSQPLTWSLLRHVVLHPPNRGSKPKPPKFLSLAYGFGCKGADNGVSTFKPG